jgi:hypothetical protein
MSKIEEAVKLLKAIIVHPLLIHDHTEKELVCRMTNKRIIDALALLEAEREPVEPEDLLVCECGWMGGVMDQDALGTECGCCPDCGREDLVFVNELRAEIDRLAAENKALVDADQRHMTRLSELAKQIDRLTAERESWRRVAEKLETEKRIEAKDRQSEITALELERDALKEANKLYAEAEKKWEAENKALKRPMEVNGFKVEGMLAVGNELIRLTAENKAKDAEIEQLTEARDGLHIDFVERGAEIRKLKNEIERLKRYAQHKTNGT